MPVVPKTEIKRNEPCPCGSGLKGKCCHGDRVKIMICTRVANEHMAKLIRQEQKKHGLVPYRFTCNGCGVGFDEPDKSTVAPHLSMCPQCGSTDLTQNVETMKSEENDGGEKESEEN